jgi:corrinoid protein of di/trimethylamine methyltransferase
MSETKEELFEALASAVVDMDEDAAAGAARAVVAERYDAFDAINDGLAVGMQRVGALFETGEYFVPELLMCADAMNAGTEVLTPHIERLAQREKKTVVIGVVEGDTHDIGKNLVKLMLDSAGFEVEDLGRDVPPRRFVEKAVEVGADVIALSTLMSTTMESVAEVIRILEREQLRDRYLVIVGGAPLSPKFAERIGADGYADNATEAIRLVNRLTEEKAPPEAGHGDGPLVLAEAAHE